MTPAARTSGTAQDGAPCGAPSCSTGEHLWAEGYTRPFEDVLQLQMDLAGQIARELKGTLVPKTKRQLASGREVDSAA